MRLFVFFTVLTLVGTLGERSAAQDTIIWKDNIRGWEIRVDQSIGNACFMISDYEDGSFLRTQFNPDEDNFQFIIGNDAWKSIEAEKLYPMSVQFGNRAPWTGDGKGHWWGDTPSLMLNVSFDKGAADDFIDEFMKMTGVIVEYKGQQIANLSLNGTYAAMQEVIACQSAMLENSSNSDPFAPSSGSDPFK
ncbi:MAG: hypothetical protein HUJ27_17115 [Rhodobacteraceae bacterium]|nr:hypothetical protein [Paracoccaceae bacterium]